MNPNILAITVLSVIALVSFILGWLFAKIVISRRNKKLLKNLEEVMEGEKENFVEFEGVKYPAEKFRLRDENNKEILIDLKGGKIEQDANKENIKKERKKIIRESNPPIRENSRSVGKKKRNSRARDGRRFRRFG